MTDADDIDDIAVERAVNGDKTVTLNRAEHRAAWEQLERRGLSALEIADVLGDTPRTVVRWRNGHSTPVTRKGSADMMTTDTIQAGARSPSKRIQAAARKAQLALDHLRQVMADEFERTEAMEEISRLEAELAAAKAKLRGKPGPKGKVPAQRRQLNERQLAAVRANAEKAREARAQRKAAAS